MNQPPPYEYYAPSPPLPHSNSTIQGRGGSVITLRRDSLVERPPGVPWPQDAATRKQWLKELDIPLSGDLPKAIVANDRDRIEHLMKHGKTAPLMGPSALHLAALFNEVDLVRRLATSPTAVNDTCTVPIDLKKSRDKATPLHFAIAARHPEAIDLLVERGAKLNSDYDVKSSAAPIYLLWNTWLDATAVGSPQEVIDILQRLIKLGWNVNESLYCSNWTMLHFAAFLPQERAHIREEVVRFLLDNGATLSAFTDTGRTPIHVAANSNWTAETLRMMIAKSPELVNAQDRGGETALHCAVRNRALNPTISLDVIHALCEAGGNVSIRNRERLTPAFVAQFYKDKEAGELLMRYYKDDQSMTTLRRWSITDNPQRQMKMLSGGGRSRTKSLPLLPFRRRSIESERRGLLGDSTAASSVKLGVVAE